MDRQAPCRVTQFVRAQPMVEGPIAGYIANLLTRVSKFAMAEAMGAPVHGLTIGDLA